jgi:hypothetical protein
MDDVFSAHGLAIGPRDLKLKIRRAWLDAPLRAGILGGPSDDSTNICRAQW